MVCAFCFAETVFPLLIPLLKERLRVGEDEIAVCNGANLRAKETSASFHSNTICIPQYHYVLTSCRTCILGLNWR
jgi:hypothetical protein